MRNLIDRLPRASAYTEARLNDPEVAEAVLAQPDAESPPYRPTIEEFTPEVATLYGVVDMLGGLIQAVIASNGGKPPHIPSPLRPVTEIDRAKARQEKAAQSSLVDEYLAATERWQAAGN